MSQAVGDFGVRVELNSELNFKGKSPRRQSRFQPRNAALRKSSHKLQSQSFPKRGGGLADRG